MLAGYVCLVGAGPGDAGLITRQGLAYLKRAEVVLYDHLVPVELLLEARAGCELINVGKQCGKPSYQQEAINELLIAKARSGKFVVRLKGGDPFLFGRGGEEAQALVAAQIPYLFVPGVSSSLSVPAATGIPVTDRRWAPGLTIGTGHRAENAPPDQRYTQVILMSLENLAEVTAKLVAQGYPEDTPAAVISRGTTPFQKLITATLANIVARAAREQLPVPALLVVGAVVRLAETLEWRKYLPLNSRRILWTRPREAYDQALLGDLRLLGAQVVRLPTFEIQPFEQDAISTMLPELRESDWVVFTSRKAVEIFFHIMVQAGRDWRYFEATRFAVVGERTAAAMGGFGRIPDLVAARTHSTGLLQELLARLRPREQVALCQAETTLPYLTAGLTEAKVQFREYKLYRLVCPVYPADLIARVFNDPFDVVIFTAPQAVTNYFRILKAHGLEPGNTRYACLGRETALQLEKAGQHPWLIPPRPHLEELVKSILAKWEVNQDVSRYPSAPVASNSGTAPIIA